MDGKVQALTGGPHNHLPHTEKIQKIKKPVVNEEKVLHMFLRSQRNAALLTRNNFVYRCERFQRRKSYWLCLNYKTDHCNARLIFDGDLIVKETIHNHVPDFSRFKKAVYEYKSFTDDDIKATPIHTKSTWETDFVYEGLQIAFGEIIQQGDSILEMREITVSWTSLDFICSQRGHPLLIIGEYLYRHNRGHYWRCIGCTKYNCRSRIILKPGRPPWCIGAHTHPPETDKIQNGGWLFGEFELVPNRKHGTNLYINGYMYRKKAVFSNTINWICSKAAKKCSKTGKWEFCSARVITNQSGSPPTAVWIQNAKLIFTKNPKGRELLNFRGYTYTKEASFKTCTNWVCTSGHGNKKIQCNARCVTKTDGAIKLGKQQLRFVMSNKGCPQLVYCGYVFNYERSRGNRKYWACAGRYLHKCSVRVMTSLDNKYVYTRVCAHDHEAPTKKLQKKKLYPIDLDDVLLQFTSVRCVAKIRSFTWDNPTDLIPLHSGSVVYVSKKDLISIFTNKPPVYTSRLADLLFGEEALLACKEKYNVNLTSLDPVKLKSLISENVSPTYEYIMSSQGRLQILFEDHVFTKNHELNDRLKAVKQEKQEKETFNYIDADIKDDVMHLHSKIYKKYMGRAFRSYWRCINASCGAQLVLSDLKGGSIKVMSEHTPDCTDAIMESIK
uniref:FLYWCH-type domain-containing protein n=1 Tax=Lutzomyia longipalpis TaxID=7200 RepID=A0A1B0CAM1_LUTLO